MPFHDRLSKSIFQALQVDLVFLLLLSILVCPQEQVHLSTSDKNLFAHSWLHGVWQLQLPPAQFFSAMQLPLLYLRQYPT
jgi:hypothetical protein